MDFVAAKRYPRSPLLPTGRERNMPGSQHAVQADEGLGLVKSLIDPFKTDTDATNRASSQWPGFSRPKALKSLK